MRYLTLSLCIASLALVFAAPPMRGDDARVTLPVTRLNEGPATRPSAEKSREVVRDVVKEAEETTLDDGPTLKDSSIKWLSLNRNGQIDLTTGTINYAINMQGRIDIPKGVQVVAMGSPAAITEALDQDGQSMLQARQDIVKAFGGNVATRAFNYQPVQFQNGLMQGNAYLQLDRITAAPTKISSLKGFVSVVVCLKKESKTLDAAVGDFVPFSEGVSLKVEQYQINPQSGNITVTIRKPVTDPQRSWEGAMSTPPVILAVELVDEEGKTVAKPDYMNNNMRGSDRNFIMTSMQGQFQGNAGAAKSIKVTIATKLAEKQVPFELKDVPLP